MDQGVSQRAVRHGMLVHSVGLEVAHHVLKTCLSSALGPLLLDLVHLLEVLLGRRIQLRTESFLGCERSGFGLAHLVDLEATAHGRVHHDLTWSLDLLEAIEGNIV